jgi:hypothetical protein
MKCIDWDSESSFQNLGYMIEITAASKPVIREYYHENPGKGAIENIPLTG